MLTGGATKEETNLVAEKLRSYVASQSLGGRPAGEITVSAGVAVLESEKLDAAELFSLADKALYKAKDEGRNRVVMAESS